jgi:hypothetical protein
LYRPAVDRISSAQEYSDDGTKILENNNNEEEEEEEEAAQQLSGLLDHVECICTIA